jgi:hypothetical protein
VFSLKPVEPLFSSGIPIKKTLGRASQLATCYIKPMLDCNEMNGGLEHFLFFHSVGNVIIPTDELIYFSEG